MSSGEKRHMSHRMGSMLHHRFPNGFTDLFMDETDREVSTLTDRAFRSLCVGDDAVYNDEFLYGYSPFSCHKPLVGDPLKKTHHKESKKHGHSKNEKNNSQPWKQQHTNISNMSSFLKAFSVTEKSCEGMLIKNGDTNGESWDKSALRSIQRELSEFSSDYHANMRDRQHKNHHGHTEDGMTNKTNKGSVLSSGKSSKVKNGKTTVKLKKLNIKNFFLHSEFSPFQSWRDFNQFPFAQEETVPSILPTDTVPKWYDLPFYKKLTDSHRKEILHTVESKSCQKAAAAVEPPPTVPKPIPPPPPPKVLPKPSASPAEKRCSSHVGEGTAAPWRRNRSRATSAVPVNQPGIPSQDRDSCSRTADESFSVVKKEFKSVEVKAIEESSSVASTPFSICQLMTPVIPSRQPTETSEILQDVLSPSALDLQLRPHSEAKGTPEPTIKRDGYKSLASSILFNLKDNRKRVKSRYSPPKFKTLELPEDDVQSPSISDDGKLTHSDVSGLNTPVILKDGQTVCSPILESPSTPTADFSKHNTDRNLSDDYLLSNLLQSKKEAAGEETLMSPFLHSKKNRSPAAKRQNYPSLHLYRKAPQEDIDNKYLQIPPKAFDLLHTESDELSPVMLDKQFSPLASQTDIELSPNILTVNKDQLLVISPYSIEKDKLSPNEQVGTSCSVEPNKAKDKDFGSQPVSKRKESGSQVISTMDVIRAAKEAINAAKNKARSAAQWSENNKAFSDVEEREQRELKERDGLSKDRANKKREKTVPADSIVSRIRSESATIALEDKRSFVKEPPPVPKRNFSKCDIEYVIDKHQPNVSEKPTHFDSIDEKLDLPQNEYESVSEQSKAKHIFSAKLNNYIKNQRCAAVDEEEVRNLKKYEENVNTRTEMDEKSVGDSEHIGNDLHALKELERARFGDRILENAKNKFGLANIDKEAKAKSDLISKELRNIKRGMLSMRGNTSTKRDIFPKQDQDQEKQEVFPVMDNNVIVNKALINDNYDKAKMALEEIISEREKRKKKSTEDAIVDEKVSEESYVKRIPQSKHAMKDSMVEGREKKNSSTSLLKETDVRERLTELRDHNHVRQILSHTEPRLGESHRLGGRIALPGMDRVEPQPKNQGNLVLNKLADNPGNNLEEVDKRYVERRVSEESAESLLQEIRGKPLDTPRVPPRSKRIGGRRHDSMSMLDEDIFYKTEMIENGETCLNNISSTSLEKQEVDSNLLMKEAEPIQSPPISGYDTQSGPNLSVASKLERDKMEANLRTNLSPSWETMFENSNAKPQEVPKVKQIAPLKPDQLLTPDDRAGKVVEVNEVSKRSKLTQDISADTETVSETPRSIISPTLMVNGVSINQSPPDQSSLSSKSSYFSVDSALQRKEETESYVDHSLENMIRELDKEMQCTSPHTKQDSDRTEYYSLSDHESEPEVIRSQITSPPKQTQVPHNVNKDGRTTFTDQSSTHEEDDQTTTSPTNTLSPTLGIPSLFKVKDNTFNGKTKKTAQTWAPKTSILQRSEEEAPQEKATPKLFKAETPNTNTLAPITPGGNLEPTEIVLTPSPPVLSSVSNLPVEKPKKPQVNHFLAVPQEDGGFSGVSPLSEEVEGLTTSTVVTVEEIKMSTGVLVDHEVSKVPSERSGSTCSGNDSQTGLPKPPAVLPKSEKAVLKAIKLTNRRIKKEEAQKTSHKSSQSSSSSKHRSERHKSDKSEQKLSSSRSGSKSSERKHREKREDDQHHQQHHHSRTSNDSSEQVLHEKRGHTIESIHRDKAEVNSHSHRQSLDFSDCNNISKEALSSVANERQGRSSNRNIRDKSRRYSTDRVFSNVPVYKAYVGEKSLADRPLNRSQSFDRQAGDKVQRRFSADMSINEKVNTRSQHIEKSIMDGLQQRGRVRDKAPRENTMRRSHSIDAYSTEAPQPSTLSRQSSHNSQLSRQSSFEHAIVTQSFPVTQRKLLQDPDSGQYFVVDMPVQIKTKTFFDPETGSYVQLPVQPQDGTIPQPSPMEVLTPPLVVYHGFVPVPLSPMAQKATIQTVSVDPEEFEQRHLERSRQKHCREGQPYLEPVFGQHDHFLGEFMSTEELDCPS